jgi:hypothetical protein
MIEVELARHIARAALRSSHEIGDLLPFLKEHLAEDAYARYAEGIATAVASIQLEVMDRIFSDVPQLKQEFENQVNRYGRVL